MNITINISVDLIALWAIATLSLLAAHWFRWPNERPPRLLAYIIGTLCLNVPFMVWLMYRSLYSIDIALAQWGNIVIGGFAVIMAYDQDDKRNKTTRASAAEKAVDDGE